MSRSSATAKLDLSQILSQIDILTIIGQDVTLKRKASTNGGEYCGPCPNCPGSKDCLLVWPKHPDGKGHFQCRKCERRGDVLDYLKLYKYMSHADALGALGIQHPARSNGHNGNGAARGRVVATFDYQDATGQVIYRAERIEPGKDGRLKEFRMSRPDGKGRWTYKLGDIARILYRLPDILASQPDDTVIIAEGEAKADLLHDMGFVATAIAGGAGGIIPPDMPEILAGHPVGILPDNDDPGRKFAAKLAGLLAGRAASVKVVELPDLPVKGDVIDWRKAGGTTRDLELLIRDTPAYGTSPEYQAVQPVQLDKSWTLIPASEVRQRPPVRWLLKSKIAAASISVLFGEPGAGKSFLAQDWAEQIAQYGTAIYVAAEGAYQDRLIAWEKHHRQASRLLFFEDAIALIRDDDVTRFIDLVQPVRPHLIVFDTLAWVMGGDENSTEHMQRLIAACRAIARQTGAAILLVHHVNKTGIYRGSSALKGGADIMLEAQNDDGRIKLVCEKSKNAAAGEPEYFQLVTIDTRRDEDGEMITSCIVEPADRVVWTKGMKLTGNKRAILEHLSLEIFSLSGGKVKDIMESLKLGKSSVYSSLNALKRAGFVRQASSGDPFYITDEGRAAINLSPGSPKEVQLDLLDSGT